MRRRVQFFCFAAILVLLVSMVSCDMAGIGSSYGFGIMEAIEEFGSVSKIYSVESSRSIVTIGLPDSDSARYMTGQHLTNFRGKYDVVFEAHLVEYNSINAKILKYVEENVASDNALMHQHYPGFTSENIDPDKKYVEFATYSDYETGKPLYHEVRIFWGNFMDTFNQSYWYAKSLMFSPNLEIDVSHNVNINSGKPAFYTPNVKTSSSPERNDQTAILEMRETQIRTPLMSRLGEVNRVFAWYEGENLDLIDMFNSHHIFAICYLVELNSLSAEVLEATSDISQNGLHQREWTIESVDGKYYVEVVYYDDTEDPNNCWTSLRLRDEKMPDFKYGYYTKCFNI